MIYCTLSIPSLFSSLQLATETLKIFLFFFFVLYVAVGTYSYFSSGAGCKPFPSCFLRLFQNEPWCVTFRMEMSSICNIMNEQVKLISINMKS